MSEPKIGDVVRGVRVIGYDDERRPVHAHITLDKPESVEWAKQMIRRGHWVLVEREEQGEQRR